MFNIMIYFLKGTPNQREHYTVHQKSLEIARDTLHSKYTTMITVITARASRNQCHNHFKSKSAAQKEPLAQSNLLSEIRWIYAYIPGDRIFFLFFFVKATLVAVW